MKELLATTESAFRIFVMAEHGVAVARVSPMPSWWEPRTGEPFTGESRSVLGQFDRCVVDVSETASLTARESARLIKGVVALKAKTGSTIVVAGSAWRSEWVGAGFPVFASVRAAIDCSPEQTAATTIWDRPRSGPRSHARVAPNVGRVTRARQAPMERRVSALLHSAKFVLIEAAIFVGAVVFIAHYVLQHLTAATPP